MLTVFYVVWHQLTVKSSPILNYERWRGADPGFLAVSPEVTSVINPVVGCCYMYFPPGPRLLSH